MRLGNRTYRAWESKIGLKNRELNGSVLWDRAIQLSVSVGSMVSVRLLIVPPILKSDAKFHSFHSEIVISTQLSVVS